MGVTQFVDAFVHDSKVGFLQNAEPFSYFSTRGVTESSRSISGWIEANVTRPVDKAVESTVDYAAEKAEQAKKAAAEAAAAAEKKAQQAMGYAAQKAQQVKQAAADAATSAGQAISNTTQQAIEGLEAAWKRLDW